MTRKFSLVFLLLTASLVSVALLASPGAGQTVAYRLANGTVEREGRVERYNSTTNQYESVCDVFWDLNAADVFCRSQGLGFAVQAQVGPRFGEGTGGIWGAPACSGGEGSLDECSLNKTAACPHSQDAGVVCSGPLETGSSKIGFVRIHSSKRSDKYDGLPQIALSDGFAFFCFGSLDQTSAEVTCQSAGYQRLVQYVRVDVTGDAVDLGNLITLANCTGDEVNLKSCALTIGQGQCKDNALQQIECEAPAEGVPSLASNSDAVRLSGGTVAREGRVEVRRNGTWQSVCANEWQWPASNLVCSSLNRGYAITWYTGSLYRGGGSRRVSPPLLCTSNARNLSDCLELIPPSPADCTAEGDEVGVVCSGPGLGYSLTQPARQFVDSAYCGPTTQDEAREDWLLDGQVAAAFKPSQPNILRLVGGTTLYNGVVEWRRPDGSNWTPLAHAAWSDAHSTVACRTLGFTNVTGAYSVPQQSTASITCISSLSCSGSEGSFGECTGLGVNSHCTMDLAGIQCAGPLEEFTLATPAPSISPSTPAANGGAGISATAIAVGVVVGVVALLGTIILTIICIFVILKFKQGGGQKTSMGTEKWY